ncbi:MAG TPA: class I SAM-dependent methyltransferase [Actinomycetota bacterium]|nr:class I SAM-dependent methyltransferase [Actinomycetota bacterium]
MSSIYDERYAGNYRESLNAQELARWGALEHFITRVAKIGSARRVLDYGAGIGLHVDLWEEVFPGAELHFTDISSVAMQKFKTSYPRHADRYVLDAHALPDASFDAIVSVEVMEHVEDLDAYVRDVRRLLAPGGTFAWTTPCANALSVEHVYSTVTGRVDATDEGYRRWRWEDPTHLRRLKTREIESFLRDRGFTHVEFRLRSHVFSFVCTYFPVRRLRPALGSLVGLDYALFRRLPNGASMIGAAR